MKVRCAFTKMMDVDLLVPHPMNPNGHGEKQIELLSKILNHQGWRHPITVSKRSGFIVAGHGRLMAAKKLGWTEAPVDEQEFETEADEYAHLIADNKIAELAEHDDLKMFEDLKKFPDLDLDLLGIPDLELPSLEVVPGCDADEVPEALPDPKVVRGEVYILGSHRLMCGDSTSIDAVEKLMMGQKADMVFTDPPYGFNYVKKSNGESIQNDGEEFAQVIRDAISSIKADSYFVCGDGKTAKKFLDATEFLGDPKCLIVWKKPIQHRMHKFEPCHELIWFWGSNGSPFYGENVFECKREINKMHPTIKPIELIEYCLRSTESTNVVDLFGGSGSTLIACEKTNRKCFMMELDPHYCGVILDRWQKFTGQKAHREDGVAWDEIRSK